MTETAKYFIGRNILSGPHEIEITKSYYENAKDHFKNLMQAYFIENKFDLLMGNYYDFEIELLTIAAKHCIYKDYQFSDYRRDVIRKFVNLMTACTLYLDHLMKTHIKTIFGKGTDEYLKIDNLRKELYEKSVSYQIM